MVWSFEPKVLSVEPEAREYPAAVVVVYFAHLCHEVGSFNEFLRCIAACNDNLDAAVAFA